MQLPQKVKIISHPTQGIVLNIVVRRILQVCIWSGSGFQVYDEAWHHLRADAGVEKAPVAGSAAEQCCSPGSSHSTTYTEICFYLFVTVPDMAIISSRERHIININISVGIAHGGIVQV